MTHFQIPEETKGVVGVTWLADKIYVVCKYSKTVHVFQDRKPFKKLNQTEVEQMKSPQDLTASKTSMSVYISDLKKMCIWKIKINTGDIIRIESNRKPYSLSVTVEQDELIVAAKDVQTARCYLDIYDLHIQEEQGPPKKTIILPDTISKCLHAVQLSRKNTIENNYIIAYEDNDDENLIGEVSKDGEFLRYFPTLEFNPWSITHLQIDEYNNIFIADHFPAQHRVLLLNYDSERFKVLFKKEPKIMDPFRLCYVAGRTGKQNKNLLIVGQDSQPDSTPPVSVIKIKNDDLEETRRLRLDNNKFEVEGEAHGVVGVTWLENRIYVLCRKSQKVHVFPDRAPFTELKENMIEITGIESPQDMTASTTFMFIFINELKKKCIWKINVTDNKIKPWKINRKPYQLSVANGQNELIVVTKDDTNRCYLDIYNLNEQNDEIPEKANSIILPNTVRKCCHAIQLSVKSVKKYIISYQEGDESNLIGEISEDGKFLRSFPSLQILQFNPWDPCHLQINEYNNIYIADRYNTHHRVWLLNYYSENFKLLFKRENNIKDPLRLCYVSAQNENLLIVGQESQSGINSPVSVFELNNSNPVEETKTPLTDKNIWNINDFIIEGRR